MPSERGRQSKILLKENGVVSYKSKNNAYIFCRFFSNVAGSLLRKLRHSKNKLAVKTREEYYQQICFAQCKSNFF